MSEMCYRCMKPEIHGGRCRSCGARAWQHSEMDDPDILPPGTLLDGGNVMVGMPLGRGGFGITYIARDQQMGLVALKEFFPKHMTRRDHTNVVALDNRQSVYEKCRKDFQREARLIHALADHPNVVNVYFTLEENNTCYYGMELLKGCSLSTYLAKHGMMTATEAVMLLDPVLDALESMHQEKMMHRDISPENIFLREVSGGYVPCLIDFGAAYSARNDFTQTMPRVKNMNFSPPDQNFALDQQGPPMDIYALCATLYYMVSGKVPTAADERIVSGLPLIPVTEHNPKIPGQLWKIIEKGMSLERLKRYQTVRELRAELRKLLPPEALERLNRGMVQEKKEHPLAASPQKPARSRALLACLAESLVFYAIPLVCLRGNWPLALIIGFVLYGLANIVLMSIPPYGTLGMRLLGMTEAAGCVPAARRILYGFLRALAPFTLVDEALSLLGLYQPSLGQRMLETGNDAQENIVMECLQMIESDHVPVGPCYIMPLGPEHEFVLGRGTELITEHATLVSREHCTIRYSQEGPVLYENGSRNGTWVNKEPMAANTTRVLQPGDMIDLGGQVMFRYDAVPLKALSKHDTVMLKPTEKENAS